MGRRPREAPGSRVSSRHHVSDLTHQAHDRPGGGGLEMGFLGWADQAGAPVLQQNAPGLVPGDLTGLGHGQSRLVEAALQEVPGTDRRILAVLSQPVQRQQVEGIRRRQSQGPARHVKRMRPVRGHRRRCRGWGASTWPLAKTGSDVTSRTTIASEWFSQWLGCKGI